MENGCVCLSSIQLVFLCLCVSVIIFGAYAASVAVVLIPMMVLIICQEAVVRS